MRANAKSCFAEPTVHRGRRAKPPTSPQLALCKPRRSRSRRWRQTVGRQRRPLFAPRVGEAQEPRAQRHKTQRQARWSPPRPRPSARPRRGRPSARGTCPRPRRPAGAVPLLSCSRTTPPSRAPRGGRRRPSARGPRPAKGETPSPTSAGGPAPIPSRGACRRLGHWPWRGCPNWYRSSGLRRESRLARYDGP